MFALIPVQRVEVPLSIGYLVAFFDLGSNINIVRTGWAEAAGLQGIPVTRTVYTAGGDCKEWDTKLYGVPLRKLSGEVVSHCYGNGLSDGGTDKSGS